ncbi:M15 family metallopeptidase [Deinococcus yunweiensis]|uniref:M15 family metallopeptidase n=1 Tax=Deinococcus yunweiensis TaxID=367282 RepID=UPI00398E886A
MNDFLSGLDAQIKKHAPTTAAGQPNPFYNEAMLSLLTDQRKTLLKAWNGLGSSLGSGEGWEQGRTAVMSLLGLQDGPTPTPQGTAPGAPPVQPTQTPPAQPAPPQAVPVTAPAPTTGSPRGEVLGNQELAAPTPAPAQPLPARVQDIPASRLLDMPDDQLVATYGQGGLEYAVAARTAYAERVKAQRAADVEANTKFWKSQFEELAKNPNLTPDQRGAMFVIDQLNRTPTADLTPDQQRQYAAAVTALAPAMYTAASWGDLLGKGDPTTILAALPLYQQHAPAVVAGFDPEPFRTTLQSKLDRESAAAAVDYATAGDYISKTGERDALLPGALRKQDDDHDASVAGTGKVLVETGRLTELLPLEKQEYGDKHLQSVATTDNINADTGNTRQDTATAAFDLGVKRLAGLAATQAGSVSMYGLQHDGPDPKNPAAGSTWATLKTQLGVNDQALAAMLAEGRYKYTLGIKGDELENQLKGSEILTDGARRGGILATTSMTLEEIKTEIGLRQPKIDQLNAQIANTQAGTENYRSLVAERDRLVGEREQLLTAQAAAAQGSANSSNATANQTTLLTPVRVAQGWANVADIQQRLKLDRERLAAYVQGVKGQTAVDMAQVQNLTARTALTRTQTPGDPLYRPELKTAKATDPVGVIKATADTKYYVPMRNALSTAQRFQTTIDGLVKQYTGASGSVNRKELEKDPAYLNAVQGRDQAMKMAQDYFQKGDDFVTSSFERLDKSTPGTPAGEPQPSPFKTLNATPGVTLSAVSPQLVSRMDTMLGTFTAPGGLVPIITQGIRTAEEQAALYAKGRTVPGPNATKARPLGDIVTNAKPGESNHEDGDAVDISWMDPRTGKVLPGTDPRALAAWKALGAQAPRYGLRWGGTFKSADGKPLVDMYHFEVSGQPVATTPRPATPATPKSGASAFRPNPQLEAGLQAAVINSDGSAVNTYGAELMKAGYTQDQVLALVTKYKGGKK